MDALRHLGELERVAEQDEPPGRGAAGDRVGEAVLAGFVDHERVELAVELLAREQPRRSRHELDLGIEHVAELSRLHVLALVVVAAVLDAAELQPLLGRRLLHRVEEVVDHLVALRRDPDLPPLPQEMRDQARATVGLARPGRPLHDEVRARRAGRAARAARRARGTARASRRAAARAAAAARGADRRRRRRAARRRTGAAPPAVPSWRTARPGRARSAAAASRMALPRLSVTVPVTLSSAVTVQPVPSSCGSSPPLPSSKWCCWAGKVNVHVRDCERGCSIERSTGSCPSCSRQPSASPSSTSSSSVISRRRKYHHQAGRASRLWYSSSRAASSRPSPSFGRGEQRVAEARRSRPARRPSPPAPRARAAAGTGSRRRARASASSRRSSSQSRSSSVARQSSRL